MNKGKLYLIPAPLGDNDPAEVIPAPVLALLPTLDCFVVEEVRTARRYLSRAGLKGHIEGLEFHELNEHTASAEIAPLARLFDNGRNVGLISEAGLPAVADPGAALVALCHREGIEVAPLCHREGIEVAPLVGPSSLMLALMASGLNGQSFAFVGYIPAKTEDRRAAIRRLEKRSAAERQTQILIETPYRNDSLFTDLLATLGGKTLVTVAANITQPDAFIRTQSVAKWKEHPVTIGKRPCVFLILA